MKNRLFILLIALFTSLSAVAEEPVRLVVNIVISGIRDVDLERYEAGFKYGGFRRLLGGENYTHAYYPFVPTTPAALATISTGALPSLHGVVGKGWWNQNSGTYTCSVADASCSTFGADAPESRVSNQSIVVESLGDVVVRSREGARSVSVAADPSSAIILGGTAPSEVWWIDSLSATWTTSTKFKTSLPRWVSKYNATGYWRQLLGKPWVLSRPAKDFVNLESVEAKPYGYKPSREERKEKPVPADIRALLHSHISNSMVADFAKEAIIYNKLGADRVTDILNVCFDSPSRIVARYGFGSREVEDMYYRLDESLADLMNFASAQAGGKVLFVLTTDGSPREVKDRSKVFNASQARFLIGSFLSATYGKDEWVLGVESGGVWLNRTLAFSKGLDLAALQRQVGSFALGLRGVSHAITASDMMAGDAKEEGVVAVVQRGFYPKHSPDIYLVLMPDWCVAEEEGVVPRLSKSLPYAPYRKAIMAISGMGVEPRQVEESVDVRTLVVRLADRIGVEIPLGAEM